MREKLVLCMIGFIIGLMTFILTLEECKKQKEIDESEYIPMVYLEYFCQDEKLYILERDVDGNELNQYLKLNANGTSVNCKSKMDGLNYEK